MQSVNGKLVEVPVHDVVTYEYDDMMAYVSVSAFLSMTTVLLLILSL